MTKINLDNPAVKKALLTFLFLCAVFLLLFFRNPRLFIYPEPWAEDMRIFLSQEYNTGFPETAFTLYAGYIHLLPRIIAWISMKFGLSDAMRVMNISVLLIKILVIYLIYKSQEIRSGVIKLSLIAYLVLLPFADEVCNNVTNLQWWLIPLIGIVIIKHETSAASLAFSCIVLFLSGLTGINSFLFALPCAYLLFETRTMDCLIKTAIVIGCSFVQFYCLFTSPRIGQIIYEGSLLDIIYTFVNRVIYHTLFNFDSLKHRNILVFLVYLAMLVFNFWHYRKNLLVRFIYLFSSVYIAAIFYNFMKYLPATFNEKDFHAIITGFIHERYFVFLRICSFMLLVSTLDIAFRSIGRIAGMKYYRQFISYSVYLLCLTMLAHYPVNMPTPFEYKYYGDLERYEQAKPGETVKFHFPPGWNHDLVKKTGF